MCEEFLRVQTCHLPARWLSWFPVWKCHRFIESRAGRQGLKASGAGTWSPNYLDIAARHVAEAHELGLAVVPWTVNEPADMTRLLDLGVDGLVTDRCDTLKALVDARN